MYQSISYLFCFSLGTFMFTRSSERILKILNIRLGSTMAGLTLEIDSEHKNKNTGFYPNSLRPFLGILCVVDA